MRPSLGGSFSLLFQSSTRLSQPVDDEDEVGGDRLITSVILRSIVE